MNKTYDPITREHVVTVIVLDIRYLGSTGYGSGADDDGRLVSFVLDRAVADDLAARLRGGESIRTAIPAWAIFDTAAAAAGP